MEKKTWESHPWRKNLNISSMEEKKNLRILSLEKKLLKESFPWRKTNLRILSLEENKLESLILWGEKILRAFSLEEKTWESYPRKKKTWKPFPWRKKSWESYPWRQEPGVENRQRMTYCTLLWTTIKVRRIFTRDQKKRRDGMYPALENH